MPSEFLERCSSYDFEWLCHDYLIEPWGLEHERAVARIGSLLANRWRDTDKRREPYLEEDFYTLKPKADPRAAVTIATEEPAPVTAEQLKALFNGG